MRTPLLLAGSLALLSEPAQASPAGQILAGTPWWVWVVLLLLTHFGLQAVRTRTVPVYRALIVPAVFIGWGAFGLVIAGGGDPMLAAAALGSLAAGGGGGYGVTRRDDARFDWQAGVVHLRGSWFPLIRNLTIFVAKYATAVAVAMGGGSFQTLLAGVVVSGLSAGYFLGWLARVVAAERPVPQVAEEGR